MTKKCSYELSHTITLTINVVLHVLILFAFLTVLYFFIIAPLEKKSFNDEISKEVKTNLTSQLDKMRKDLKKTNEVLDTEINNIVNFYTETNEDGSPIYVIDELIEQASEESSEITEHNRWITLLATSIIIILTFGIIIYVNTLSGTCCKKTNIGSIVKENIITFIFVGLVEYVFFTQVAFKYVPAPPSVLVTSLIDKFKETVVA